MNFDLSEDQLAVKSVIENIYQDLGIFMAASHNHSQLAIRQVGTLDTVIKILCGKVPQIEDYYFDSEKLTRA